MATAALAIDRNYAPRLLAGRNTDQGWGYYAGKASRLEPTCWALLALHSAKRRARAPRSCARVAGAAPASGRMARRTPRVAGQHRLQRAGGVHAASSSRIASPPTWCARLLAAVVASKGAAAPQADGMRQDNSLQGWSWVDATFSWVEPTCWGLLALKKARGAGLGDAAAASAHRRSRATAHRSQLPAGRMEFRQRGGPAAGSAAVRAHHGAWAARAAGPAH